MIFQYKKKTNNQLKEMKVTKKWRTKNSSLFFIKNKNKKQEYLLTACKYCALC